MIQKTFVFDVGRDHDHYFEKAKSAALTAGASFSGGPKSGEFSHRGVRGHYRVDSGLVTVELDKPIGIPWGPMERGLERFFGKKPQPRAHHL